MSTYTIAVIPGDGIGKEVVPEGIRVLEAAGSSLEDIVELVTYHTSMGDIREFARVKAEFISKNYPAWTALGITKLAFPQLLVEIKATAVIGSGAG